MCDPQHYCADLAEFLKEGTTALCLDLSEFDKVGVGRSAAGREGGEGVELLPARGGFAAERVAGGNGNAVVEVVVTKKDASETVQLVGSIHVWQEVANTPEVGSSRRSNLPLGEGQNCFNCSDINVSGFPGRWGRVGVRIELAAGDEDARVFLISEGGGFVSGCGFDVYKNDVSFFSFGF